MNEERIVNFSYSSPLSFIRAIKHILLSEGMAIKSLEIDVHTLYKIFDDVEIVKLVTTPSALTEARTICGIDIYEVVMKKPKEA